ncbi:class I SAM-dependent methyltransferase [Candidatus Uhrbacteria bacterium]|nr:class I SAM-dependent methyltransferase [Candidatus Uhrbacteria bacterium]
MPSGWDKIVNRSRRVVSRLLDPVIRRRWPYQLNPAEGLAGCRHAPLIAWLNYHQREILGKQCYWLGHRTLKNPLDAWIYQEILYETRPDIVVELGNKNGGSALFLASILELLGNGKVLGVDIDHSRITATHHRIDLVTGDCSDGKVIERLRQECQGKRVLVIHDADHSRDAVLRDLRNYAPMVSRGSYIIVEDSVHGVRGFSQDPNQQYGSFLFPDTDTPLQAIEIFLRENKSFVVDEKRERYILTANYRGFLRRVRE